jgi:GH18 family chitinase
MVDVKSMKIKADYIVKQNLSGGMFWTLDLGKIEIC